MKQLTTGDSEWLVRTTLMRWCRSTPFGSDLEALMARSYDTYALVRVDSLRIGPGGSAARTPPGWRKIDSHGPFTCHLSQIGAFSTSRSNLELDESVDDPEAADACSILISDSLLSGLKSPPFYTRKAAYPDQTVHPFIIIKLIIIPSNCSIIPQLCLLFFHLLCSKLCRHIRRMPNTHPEADSRDRAE